MTEPLLSLEDLAVHFKVGNAFAGGIKTLKAVDGVTLDVKPGECLGLVGESGCGKSTLALAIMALIAPTSGRIMLDGTDITGWRPDRIAAAGMVRTFQITQPFAGLTVAENIRVGAFLHTASPDAAMAAARQVGTDLGLGPWLDRPAGALTVSGRKRLEVARALATRPRFLLLDEVMAGLNPSEIIEIVDLIRGVRASGVTILLIEHIMQAVTALADHVYVLAQGGLIAQGSPAEIAANPLVIEAYLGRGAAERLAHP